MADVLTTAKAAIKQIYDGAAFAGIRDLVTYHRVKEDASYDPEDISQVEESDSFTNLKVILVGYSAVEVERNDDIRMGDLKGIVQADDMTLIDTSSNPVSDDDYLILSDTTRWNVKGIFKVPHELSPVVYVFNLRRHVA